MSVSNFPSLHLSFCQGSDSELKVEKDGVLESDSKVDSGVPEVPVPPDDTPEVLNKALSGLSSRYAHY